MLIHNDELPHICGQCGNKFRPKQQLKLHQQRIHSKPERHAHELPHICGQCGDKFRLKQQLDKHQQLIHSGPSPLRPYECNLCDSNFATQGSFTSHMYSAHPFATPVTALTVRSHREPAGIVTSITNTITTAAGNSTTVTSTVSPAGSATTVTHYMGHSHLSMVTQGAEPGDTSVSFGDGVTEFLSPEEQACVDDFDTGFGAGAVGQLPGELSWLDELDFLDDTDS